MTLKARVAARRSVIITVFCRRPYGPCQCRCRPIYLRAIIRRGGACRRAAARRNDLDLSLMSSCVGDHLGRGGAT